jgi:geranylgeranyl pyrophosphate synthase
VSQLSRPLAAPFDDLLRDSRERVDAALERELPPGDTPPLPLHEAMRYAVLSGGKRLRPALAFATARTCGAEPERAVPVAVAAELLHAYSLVHDDLPAMDDDDLRRGRPTVHVRYGEACAILVGDALQALAFGCLGRARAPGALVAMLADAAGSRSLVGGQADDVWLSRDAGSRPVELAEITSIHERKTAALFGFSVVGAALMCGASEREQRALAEFAGHYGHAFQLLDDLGDAEPGECSVLLVLAPGEVQTRAALHIEQALAALEMFGEKAEPLRALGEGLRAQLT